MGDFETALVRVRQGSGPVETVEGAIRDGAFEIVRPLTADISTIAFHVELLGPSARHFGAPPPFTLAESGGYVAVSVGAPSTCAPLADVPLVAGRTDAAVVRLGSFAVVAGGYGSGTDASSAEFLDLLRVSGGELPDLPRSGSARGAALDARRAVLVFDEGGVLLDLAGPSVRTLALPSGVSSRSAVLSLDAGGAVLVGGGSEEAPSDQVVWIASDGTIRTTRLAVPRWDPAAVARDGEVWVAGGSAPGRLIVETIRPDAPEGTVVADVEELGDRSGAVALVHPRDRAFFLLGGRTADGSPRGDTVLVACASTPCVLSPGPLWEEPRTEVTATRLSVGTLLVGGRSAAGSSTRIERVAFRDETPAIEEFARLSFPRRAAGAFVLESGVLYVVGGFDGEAAREDVELCLPAALEGP